MKKLTLTVLVAVLFILILPVPNVLAQAYTQFSLPPVGDARYGHPQLAQVTMSSGKFVYAYSDENLYLLYVRVFSASGSFLGSTQFSIGGGCNHYTDDVLFRLSMIELDANEVLLSYMTGRETNSHHNFGVARVNIDTFTQSLYWGTERAVSSGAWDAYASQIFQNGTNFYGIIAYDEGNNGAYEHYRWKFDSSTNTLSDTHDTSIEMCGQIFGFQDESDNTLVYLIGADENDENRTVACTWDLDNWSNDLNFLANAPVNDIWYQVQQSSYEPDITFRKALRYIDGGAFWNATESKYYLYFTWARSYDTNSFVSAVQWRLSFNSSGYDELYLQENNRVIDTVPPTTGFPTSMTSVHGGFHQQDDPTTFFVYCEARYAEPSDYRSLRIPFVISDWYNFASSTITYLDTSWSDELYVPNYNDVIYKSPTSTLEACEEYGESWVRIYYGLDPDFEGYDVDALTYTPADTNPEVNKRYVFDSTVLLNDVGYQAEVTIYVDDIVIVSKQTEADGDFTFWLLSSVEGAHNVTVEVFDDGESKYSETTIYIFVESSADEDTQLLNIGMGGLINFVVIFALCGVPAYMFMTQAGIMGFFAGLALGAVIGFIGGVMPMYGLMLVGLICAVGIVFSRGRTPTHPAEP